jgi:metal-responsive CopG/Arc/MetJ family transcriptional regulator
MQSSISVGISLPKKIMSQIDSDRGDISRSRFLLRLLEDKFPDERRQTRNVEIKKINDPLDHGIETPRSSESKDA